jgi:hypothetical protein
VILCLYILGDDPLLMPNELPSHLVLLVLHFGHSCWFWMLASAITSCETMEISIVLQLLEWDLHVTASPMQISKVSINVVATALMQIEFTSP